MTYSEHRLRARNALAGHWVQAAIITLVAALLGGITLEGGEFNFNFNVDLGGAGQTDMKLEADLASLVLFGLRNFFQMGGGVLTALSLAMSIALVIIGGPIQLGYTKYCMGRLSGQDVGMNVLFEQFHRIGDTLVLNLIITGLVLVPSLVSGVLMVISPILGSIAMIVVLIGMIYVLLGLSMGFYILALDENCKATEAMRRSWERVNGHRMDMFILGLTFLGWEILCMFTFGIGGLFLTPYVQIAQVSFFQDITPKAQAYVPTVGPELLD